MAMKVDLCAVGASAAVSALRPKTAVKPRSYTRFRRCYQVKNTKNPASAADFGCVSEKIRYFFV